MKYFNFKNKLENTFKQINKNLQELFLKKDEEKNIISSSNCIKYPSILYDSNWLSTNSTGILNETEHITLSTLRLRSTALKNQETPFEIQFSFSKELNIPENIIPYIKHALLIQKPTEEINIKGIDIFNPYNYNVGNYCVVNGDSTLIYKGIIGSDPYYSETQRLNGAFLLQNASNWYEGTLKVMVGSDEWEIRDGAISGVQSWYNVTVNTFGSYDWDSFLVYAHNTVSSSQVNGIGTFRTSRVKSDGGGGSYQELISTLNETKTAPLFLTEGVTKIIFKSGKRYKNGIYQGAITTDYTVTIKGTLWNASTFLPSEKTGNLIADSLISFSSSRMYSSEESNVLYRLWYDSLKAREFNISISTYILTNPPKTTDYQSGSLPYSKLTVIVNPDGYPEMQSSEYNYYSEGEENYFWVHVEEDKYRFELKGKLYLSAPAIEETSSEIRDEVDEEYSPSGDTYTRDSENRWTKDLPFYLPFQSDIMLRLILSFSNPKMEINEKSKKIL